MLRTQAHAQTIKLSKYYLKVHVHRLFYLRFNGLVNPLGSVYKTTLFLGRLSPLSGVPVLVHILSQELTTAFLESVNMYTVSFSHLLHGRVELIPFFLQRIYLYQLSSLAK